MSEDRRRPGQYASLRDEVLRPWIADVVYPYSRQLRPALDRSGLGRRGVRTAADLRRLGVLTLPGLGDGTDWVLEPTEALVHTHGDLVLRGRLLVADAVGARTGFSRTHIDVPYKPVVWTAEHAGDGPLLVGSSRVDVDRLAALGRRGLSVSGVRPDDRVVLAGPGAGVGAVQLVDGCRDAGVALLHLDPTAGPAWLDAAAPTVLAGRPEAIERLVSAGAPAEVRLVILHVATPVETRTAEQLAARLGLPVSVWWAPAGVRAAWVTCPGGEGFHTWPSHELIEVLDDADRPAETGRLVWSAVGWRGSVWLRVALGHSGSVDDQPCPNCRRTTPRVRPTGSGSTA